MRQFFHQQSLRILQGKMSRPTVLFLVLLLMGVNGVQLHAREFQLSGTEKSSPVLVLRQRAMIIRVTRTAGLKSYTIMQNGSPYVTIRPFEFTAGNGVYGVLPPGSYQLRTLGGSATIYLNTQFSPENIKLWGRQTALVKPRLDGNKIVLTRPTTIISATYDGTSGMAIVDSRGVPVLNFLSPHSRPNLGPKVIGGRGGKTLVGQTLPPGVYRLVPRRGQADGIVYGEVVLNVQ